MKKSRILLVPIVAKCLHQKAHSMDILEECTKHWPEGSNVTSVTLHAWSPTSFRSMKMQFISRPLDMNAIYANTFLSERLDYKTISKWYTKNIDLINVKYVTCVLLTKETKSSTCPSIQIQLDHINPQWEILTIFGS